VEFVVARARWNCGPSQVSVLPNDPMEENFVLVKVGSEVMGEVLERRVRYWDGSRRLSGRF
jgi:hypothetical protein